MNIDALKKREAFCLKEQGRTVESKDKMAKTKKLLGWTFKFLSNFTLF